MTDESDFSPRTLAALSLTGHASALVKRLSAFRKDRHTVPDAVNPATQAFFARLCADELAAEAEDWFQRARAALDYKRRDLTLTLSPGNAVLNARHFTLELEWALQADDPASYRMTRTLRDFRDADFMLGPACDALFAATFTGIVFTLRRGVAVEAVIDAVEAMPDTSPLGVRYPANAAECTLSVPGVAAEVRCTGATLELAFPRAGSPRELIEAFGAVRTAFRFTADAALAGLL